MYMERLRRSQNVIVGLFQTGVKMLGLAEGQRQRSGISKTFLSGEGDREGDGNTRSAPGNDKVTHLTIPSSCTFDPLPCRPPLICALLGYLYFHHHLPHILLIISALQSLLPFSLSLLYEPLAQLLLPHSMTLSETSPLPSHPSHPLPSHPSHPLP
jgi:hypothetical protein